MVDFEGEKINSGFNLLAKSSIIVFIGILLSKLFTYVYRVIIARNFGPEGYGLFALATMIVGWFIAISALGLPDGITRYMSIFKGGKKTKKIQYLFRFSLVFLLFSGLFFGIVLFLTSTFISAKIFHNLDLIIYLKFFSLLIPLTALSYVFLASLRAFGKIKEHSLAFNISQNFLRVIFLILFIFIGLETRSVIFSYILGVCFMLLLAIFFCKKQIPEIFGKPKISDSEKISIKKEVFSYSIPLLFFSFISILFYWMDSFTIGYFKSAVEVGIYNAAVPIALLLGMGAELFLQLFFPLINQEYSKNNFLVIKEWSKQVGKWIFLLNMPLFLLIFLFPGVAINILFGEEFLLAETALRFLAVGALFMSIFSISDQLISMLGKSKLILFDIIIASVLNITLNFVLVPMPQILMFENSSGITGASIATAISLIVLSLLFASQAYYYTKIIPLRRKMLTVLISAIIPFLIINYLKELVMINLLSLILLGMLFVLIYALLLLILKGFDRNDLMILKNFKNKIYSRGKNGI